MITHYHTDFDGRISFCSQNLKDCPIYNDIEVMVNKVQHHCLYNNYNSKDYINIGIQRNRSNCLDKNIICKCQHDTNAYIN